MANIRVDLDSPIDDGQEVIFKSPIDCSEVTGLKIYYPQNGATTSKTFQFADAHGNNVGSIDLFAANVLVKVILHIETLKAYVQNPDTNKYLEDKFKSLGNSLGSHASQHKTGGADPLTAADVGAPTNFIKLLSGSVALLDDALIEGHYGFMDLDGAFGLVGGFYDVSVSKVMYSDHAGYTQTAHRIYPNDKPATFDRTYYYYPTGWSPWREVATTDMIPKTAADVGAVQKKIFTLDTPGVRLIDFIQDLILGKGYLSGVIQIFGATPPDCNWVGDYGLVKYQSHADGYTDVRVCRDGDLLEKRNKFIKTYDGTSPDWLFEWTEFATTDYALPRDGSKPMTGELLITSQGSSIPITVYTESSGYGFVGTPGSTYNFVRFTPNPVSVACAIQLATNATGTYKEFPILHTGNKHLITPADIGACKVVTDNYYGQGATQKDIAVPKGTKMLMVWGSKISDDKITHITPICVVPGQEYVGAIESNNAIIGVGSIPGENDITMESMSVGVYESDSEMEFHFTSQSSSGGINTSGYHYHYAAFS